MSITITGTLNESTRQINASLSITAGAKELFFSSNEVKYVQNTTVKTSVVSVTDYQGSPIVPANHLVKGDLIEFYVAGEISTGVNQQATLEIALGASVMKLSVENLPSNLNGMGFDLKAIIRIVSPTEAIMDGRTLIQTTQGVAAPVLRNLNSNGGSYVAIDTSIANTVNLSYQWATALAANILRVDICYAKLMRV